MTPKSVKKKMKTPAFAAAVDREGHARGRRAARHRLRRAPRRSSIAALEPHADELGLAGTPGRVGTAVAVASRAGNLPSQC